MNSSRSQAQTAVRLCLFALFGIAVLYSLYNLYSSFKHNVFSIELDTNYMDVNPKKPINNTRRVITYYDKNYKDNENIYSNLKQELMNNKLKPEEFKRRLTCIQQHRPDSVKIINCISQQ